MKFWSLLLVALMLGSLGGCISDTNTANFTPSPQDEGDGIHDGFSKRMSAITNRLENSVEQTGYHFFNTNAEYAPHDSFGEAIHRDLATLEQTIDWHLFNNDWADYDWD